VFDATDYSLALCAPRAARARLRVIFALDARLQAIMPSVREPLLGEIKLAWWREQLIALDSGAPPVEPLLFDVVAVLGSGLTGALLSERATSEPGLETLAAIIAVVTGGRLGAYRLLCRCETDDRARLRANHPLASPARRALWALQIRLIGR